MIVNERIKQLRQHLKVPQGKFANSISITDIELNTIEMGNKRVSQTIIKNICRKYDVNELWLTSGRGAMFNQTYFAVKEIQKYIDSQNKLGQ